VARAFSSMVWYWVYQSTDSPAAADPLERLLVQAGQPCEGLVRRDAHRLVSATGGTNAGS
jgi:hypothetical protein